MAMIKEARHVFSTRAVSVYKVLYYSESLSVSKRVLDCGAGGSNPPSYLFYSSGYAVAGIDVDDEAVKKSEVFCARKGCSLNIRRGDMRSIAFPDAHFGAVYSYNSIFHMTKKDIMVGVEEMIRVTEPGGVVFFNLLHRDDEGYGEGREIGEGTFQDIDDGVIHSYHREDEIDEEIVDCDLLEKGIVKTRRMIDRREVDQCFIEYFYRKK